MANWESNYLDLLDTVLEKGLTVETRVGPALSLIGQSLTVDPTQGEFPLLTTRRLFPKPVLGELAAFLRGATFNREFLEQGCNYWTPNARAWKTNTPGMKDEELFLGPVYGAQWRKWEGKHDTVDQLMEAKELLLKDPGSRRNIVTAWQPADLHAMCLPPCHILFQFHVRGLTLHCSVYMRSVDLCLGLPSDIILYYALLILMATDVNMLVGNVYFHFGDAHIYKAHEENAKIQVLRAIEEHPIWELRVKEDYLNTFVPSDLDFIGYRPRERIGYELLV